MNRSFLVMYKCLNHNGVSSVSSTVIDSHVITQYPTADTLKEWVEHLKGQGPYIFILSFSELS